jgi:anti-sigma factor (TIGR02949 family)
MSEADCGPDCQQALAELERFLDGELPASEVGAISQHLADCYPCTDRATFEEQLRAIVRRGCVDAAPTDLVERIQLQLDRGGLPGA